MNEALTNSSAEPPAESPPPRSNFIAPLIVFPLIVVLIFVGIRLIVSHSAHSEEDLRSMVRDLRDVDKDSWRIAYALSQHLRSTDDSGLKSDREICRELASILNEQVLAAGQERSAVEFRVFLCRALGEFHVSDGLPALLETARPGGPESAHLVRCAAVEAVAVLANNVGAEPESRALPILIEVSREPNDPNAGNRASELRSTAAFALGVIGGTEALDRLDQMLGDPHPDARYNAATGLARHGDARAIPVLLEMLDPHQADATNGEKSRDMKQALVLTNALRATVRLVETNPSVDRESLIEHVQRLTNSKNVSPRTRMDAQTVLLKLRSAE